MSARELLRRHTVFPYLSIALDSSRGDVLETQLLHSKAAASSLRFRSTFPTHIETLSRRRFCWECRRCDTATLGETYWHRTHVLPGVLVCPTHGSPLHISQVPLLAKITRARNTLPHEIQGEPGKWSASEEVLRKLAAEVLSSLNSGSNSWNDGLLTYDIAAAYCGYDCSGRPTTTNRLATEFEGHFGLPLLSLSSSAWPVKFVRGRRPAMQLQLRHILLRQFLSDMNLKRG
jgi:hypothetical protein